MDYPVNDINNCESDHKARSLQASETHELNYEVAILGGGPAGISCGMTLLRSGISCCIIDRAVFPREKTCGGLVTAKTLEEISYIFGQNIIPQIFCNETKHVKMYSKTGCFADIYTETPFRFVHRNIFDASLLDSYKHAGGCIFDGQKEYEIDYDLHKINLRNHTIRYKYLVAADGASSHTMKMRTNRDIHLGFCVETHIRKALIPESIDEVRIYFGILSKGYGWVFPKGDSCCIGIGNLYSKKTDYIGTLKSLIASLTDSKDYVIRGAYIPYGHMRTPAISRDSMLAVGDAAGLVDPIYGEGLYFALKSGRIAAESIAASRSNAISEYKRRISPDRKIIHQGKILQDIFFAPVNQKIFIKLAPKHPSFIRYYCENQILT
ncbi:MAG: geranylgeranyl reductase family protein [Clostridiales bacterium]|nr:geranylgeranyl reductase family protein [Clostridiales bacterium]